MLTRSLKSVRSIRSLKSTDDEEDENPIPSREFDELLPFVCKKFNCDFDTFVKKQVRGERQRHVKVESPKYNRMGALITPRSVQRPKTPEKTTAEADNSPECDPNFITVTGIYDNYNNLVEISIYNQIRVPRLLMKVLVVIAPLFENVSKISIRNCKLDGSHIYELKKLISVMFLTEICLDDSFLPHANFDLLLEKESTLKQFSLCRCFISDEVCGQIASKLRFPAPAEKSLVILNLSGNRITDEGAKYIGEMLRTNRHLRYLNLAGNRITDDGARKILDALIEFPLTYDEIEGKRRRILSYLRRKQELLKKMTECDSPESYKTKMKKAAHSTSSLKPSTKKKKDISKERFVTVMNRQQVTERVEILVEQLIGQLQGPFNPEHLITRKKLTYCVGNFSLSYLNLAYNELSYFSVLKILEVLVYQSSTEAGLMKIVIEGNPLPKTCSEYTEISWLLNKKLNIPDLKCSSVHSGSSKRKSARVSRVSTIGLSSRK